MLQGYFGYRAIVLPNVHIVHWSLHCFARHCCIWGQIRIRRRNLILCTMAGAPGTLQCNDNWQYWIQIYVCLWFQTKMRHSEYYSVKQWTLNSVKTFQFLHSWLLQFCTTEWMCCNVGRVPWWGSEEEAGGEMGSNLWIIGRQMRGRWGIGRVKSGWEIERVLVFDFCFWGNSSAHWHHPW